RVPLEGRASPGGRLRGAVDPARAGEPAPDRGRRARAHEAHGVPRERRAGTRGRRGRPGRRAPGEAPRGRGPRRLRGGTQGPPRAARARERRAHPPHRLGVPRDAAPDGDARRGELRGGTRRPSTAEPGKPGGMAPSMTRGKLWLLLLLLLLAGGAFLYWRQRQPAVRVTVEPAFAALGQTARPITIVLDAPAANLAAVEIRVMQQGTAHPVLSEDLTAAGTRNVRKPVTLDAAALKLQEGPAALEVEARDTLWRPRPPRGPRLVHRFVVDLTPPRLELKSATGYIKHAGAGIVVYRTEGAARSGVRIGDGFFPGVSGLAQDPAVHVAL